MAINTAHTTETVEIVHHKVTLEEFEQMVTAGVFHEDARLELIRGELVDRAPVGFDHGFGGANLIRSLGQAAFDKAVVWVQSPIRLPDNSPYLFPAPTSLLSRRQPRQT